jgi:DNA-binding response OmpR family regulator
MLPMRQLVLAVEDDRKTADIIRAYLEKASYAVTLAHDGTEGLAAARRDPPDLVVLALLLPSLNRLTVCRVLREELSIPIIMLTAITTEQDKLTGLDLGDDDYVTKPFNPRELVARVRSVLRRSVDDGSSQGMKPLSYRGLTLNSRAQTATAQGGEVHLTPTEFSLLEMLILDPGQLSTRSQLVERALGFDYEGVDRTIDVHILNLRRKIEPEPGRHKYIITVYGRGYKLGDGP